MATFESIEDHGCHAGPIYLIPYALPSIQYLYSPSRFIVASALKAGDPGLACRALNAGEPISRDDDLENASKASGERGHRALSLWLIGHMKEASSRRSSIIRLLDPSIQP